MPSDPEALYEAGNLAIRSRATSRVRAIGEALIRGFPGTIHAVRGLWLLYAGELPPADDAVDEARLQALDARLDAIVAAARPIDRAMKAEAAVLRARLALDRAAIQGRRGHHGDPEGFRGCVELLRRVLPDVEEDERWAPIVLFNDARCSEAGYRIGEAQALYRRIVEAYAESEVTEASLRALIDIDWSIARYERTAAWMERYAERYPKEMYALSYLQEALAVRVAFGQEKAARRDLAQIEALLARKDPARTAGIVWEAIALATTDAERQAHAEAYLKRYGKAGGLDRQIVAEATIAAIEWQRACPDGEVNGLCVAPPPVSSSSSSRSKAAAKLRRCAEPATPISRPRTKALAEAAQARFAAIDRRAQARPIAIPEDDRRRIAEFRDAVAESRLAALDRDLEVYLTRRLPTGLELVVDHDAPDEVRRRQVQAREATSRRLAEFFDAMGAEGAELRAGYEAIVADKQSPRVMLAAAHRVGLIFEHVADQLLSAEIPAKVVEPGAVRVFCGALRDGAAPFLERAREAYAYCARRALEFGVSNDATRACDAALTRLDRKAWPPLLEFVGEPQPWGELQPRSVGVQLEAPRIAEAAAVDPGAEPQKGE